MSIEAKHAYRFGFLKSEEWSGIRLIILAKNKAECAVCGLVNWSNDVHHLSYPKNWKDTTSSRAVVLCRACHNRIHDIFKSDIPDIDSWKFKKVAELSIHHYGMGFTADNFMECSDLFRCPRWDEQRRFAAGCKSARNKIRKHLLTTGSEVG